MIIEDTLPLPSINLAKGSFNLPGSKSISNRCLLLSSLAKGKVKIKNLLLSEDTEVMLNALDQLGVRIDKNQDGSIDITGNEYFLNNKDLFLGNAGTAFRPLTAVLSLLGGYYNLTGIKRMHERPIKDLVDALKQIGANITYIENKDFPPISIKPPNFVNNRLKIKGNVSSQFLTSILMASPIFTKKTGKDLIIQIDGELISKPYIEITLNLMKHFGVDVENKNFEIFIVHSNSCYVSPKKFSIEGDASSASYLLSMGAIGLGPVKVLGVGKYSIQGDIYFSKILEMMGGSVTLGSDWIEVKGINVAKGEKLKSFDYDFNLIPDAAMTAAILAIFADGPCRLNNIGSWRVKETDRIHAMQVELQKLGAIVKTGKDWMIINPILDHQWKKSAIIDTWNDHRMAMAFSLASFGKTKVSINNPKCVNKTFPNYFDAYQSLISELL